MSKVTFVTFGALAKKTVAIGPYNEWQFVDGEMEVSADIADKVTRALRFYCAAPKGDAEPLHLAACKKLGIDPKTLEPLSGALPGPAGGSAVSSETDIGKDAATSTEQMHDQILEVLAEMDADDDMQWTGKGIPSISWVKSKLPEALHPAVTREFLDETGVTRETTAEPEEG